MKGLIEHVAVKAPVCSKHDNHALVFGGGFRQSLFDLGARIGAFVVNVLRLCSRLAKADSARGRCCDRET